MAKPVLIGVDRSRAAVAALARGCRLAAERCGPVHLLHVAPEAGARCAAGMAALATRQAGRFPCLSACTGGVTGGAVAEAIAEAAERLDAGLIVVGRHHRRRAADWALGTTAERLLRRAHAPVLVVQRWPRRPYRTLLVAVDDGEAGRAALELAMTVEGARHLVAVHAFGIPLGERWHPRASLSGEWKGRSDALDETVAGVTGHHPERALQVSTVVAFGDAPAVIDQAARDYAPDLIVMAAHAHFAAGSGMVFSVTHEVLRGGSVDLLIGRAAGKP